MYMPHGELDGSAYCTPGQGNDYHTCFPPCAAYQQAAQAKTSTQQVSVEYMEVVAHHVYEKCRIHAGSPFTGLLLRPLCLSHVAFGTLEFEWVYLFVPFLDAVLRQHELGLLGRWCLTDLAIQLQVGTQEDCCGHYFLLLVQSLH